MSIFNRFVEDESGATAIEYSLIAALMAGAVITALGSFSTNFQTTFKNIGSKMSTSSAK